MQMLGIDEIRDAALADWRMLGQGLHGRFAVGSVVAGADFAAAVAAVGDTVGHQPDEIRIGAGVVDLRLLSRDAIQRDGEGRENRVSWVTGHDVDLARRISQLAAERALVACPEQVMSVDIGLDTADSRRLGPVWAALLTGGAESLGYGTIDDDVRDVTGRAPILWFQPTDAHETPRQRFHLDVWVGPDVAQERINAAVAAGATIVDDSEAPSFVVLADPDGNKACVCTYLDPATAGS
jgi:4a-hydroxytetrahydrobiopterin dehydratase